MPNHESRLLGPDNRIEARRTIVHSEDEEAFRSAQQLPEGCAVDVWEGLRFIATAERRNASEPDR
jgi:hypothetical protein